MKKGNVNIYDLLQVETSLRYYLRRINYKVQPNDYVNCFYIPSTMKNIAAFKQRDVQMYYKGKLMEPRMSVCLVKEIDVDLTGLYIKQQAEYNSVHHPMSITTYASHIKENEKVCKQIKIGSYTT